MRGLYGLFSDVSMILLYDFHIFKSTKFEGAGTPGKR